MDGVLLHSGGPDSTTLAYRLASEGKEILALTFNFGEEEGAAERRCAQELAAGLGVDHRFADYSRPMRDLYQSDDVHILRKRTDRALEVRSFGAGIALALASSLAAELGADRVYYAVHDNDTFAPDNSRAHFDSLARAVSIAVGTEFTIETPFLEMSKADVAHLGSELGVPFDLTWSCAASSDQQCGACDACFSRNWAFATAGLDDPTEYREPVVIPASWTP